MEEEINNTYWRDIIFLRHGGWRPSSDLVTLRQAYEELDQFYKDRGWHPLNEHSEKLLSSGWCPSSDQIRLYQAYAEITQFYKDEGSPLPLRVSERWKASILSQHNGWRPSSDQLTLQQAYVELDQFYKDSALRPLNEHSGKLLPHSGWRPSSDQITLEQAYLEIDQLYKDRGHSKSTKRSEELLARKELAKAAVEAISTAAAETGVSIVGDVLQRDAALLALRQGTVDNVKSVLRTTVGAAAAARHRERVRSTETMDQRRLRLETDATRKRDARHKRDMVETPAMRTARLKHESSLARDYDIAHKVISELSKTEQDPQAGTKRRREDEEAK